MNDIHNDEVLESDSESGSTTDIFEAVEARVVACLMEKQLFTPNNYPLSMNSLMLACNQKTNRVPVMSLTEGEIGHAVNQLEQRKMVGVDYGGRATHVTHRVMTVFNIDRKQQAVLAVLMVREPLTLNDIKTKTARLNEFSDLDAVIDTIDSLINRDEPLLVRVPKAPGSREDRFTHLLCGEVDISAESIQVKSTASNKSNQITELLERIERLEIQMQDLLAAEKH